jgi:hypothetical protein
MRCRTCDNSCYCEKIKALAAVGREPSGGKTVPGGENKPESQLRKLSEPPLSAETPSRTSRGGFSLLELMVATGVGVFLLAGAMMSFTVFSRAITAAGVYADLDRQSRNTLDIMERDIRQAAALTNWSTNGLWFTNTDGSPLTYTFNSSSGTFSFTNGATGLSAVLLSNCTAFGVSLFQDQPTNGAMVFYPTLTAQTARGVIVSFDCVRTNYAGVTDSENFQTARIVMRN